MIPTDIIKKPSFNNFSEDIPGPYYDPQDNHLHNWKGVSLIQNFTGNQDPHKEYIIINHSSIKNGMFCCICHKRMGGFISIPIINNTPVVSAPVIAPVVPDAEQIITYSKPKCTYTNKDTKKLLYRLNNHETLFIRYRDMTPFQKFKYNNPNYRNTHSFIINESTFKMNYYIIKFNF